MTNQIRTLICKIDDENFLVYGWTGTEWLLDVACGSLRDAKNGAARLRRQLGMPKPLKIFWVYVGTKFIGEVEARNDKSALAKAQRAYGFERLTVLDAVSTPEENPHDDHQQPASMWTACSN